MFEDGRRVGAVGVSGLPGEVDERLSSRSDRAHEWYSVTGFRRRDGAHRSPRAIEQSWL